MANNWDDGQLTTLSGTTTLTCGTLADGEIYGIFLYNTSTTSVPATVQVNWSNAEPTVPIDVQATSSGEGIASLGLISGNDTSQISLSLSSDTSPDAQITCWLGSISMPTDTNGLTVATLPDNGKAQHFTPYYKYTATLPSDWQQITIESQTTQFISAQFTQTYATVNVVNPTSNWPQEQSQFIVPIGTTAPSNYTVNAASGTQPQTLTYQTQGDGSTVAFMNADSPQDSADASITLQSLSAAKKRK